MVLVKLILGTVFIALLSVGFVLYIAKPRLPEIDGFPNFNAGTSCLFKIPQKYDPDFFTLKAWLKIWITGQFYNWGFKPPPKLSSFYQRYVEFQIDVDCYLMLSNNLNLNMALSSSEFVVAYNIIAERNGLELIQ